MREDLRGGLDVVPHPACQAYRLSGPNVHWLALTYIWLVTCLWAQPALLKHKFDFRFMQGVKQRTMMLHVVLVDNSFILKQKDSTHFRQPISTATTENVTKDSNASYVCMFIINSMQKPFPLIFIQLLIIHVFTSDLNIGIIMKAVWQNVLSTQKLWHCVSMATLHPLLQADGVSSPPCGHEVSGSLELSSLINNTVTLPLNQVKHKKTT